MKKRVKIKLSDGFTLIEVLFVLSICSLLLFVAVPIQFPILQHQRAEKFFEMFDSDVLLLQSTAYRSTKKISLTFDEHSYTAEYAVTGRVLTTGSYPDDWEIIGNMKRKGVVFSESGTIKKGGTIYIKTPTETYKVTFPLGKGRFYVQKQ